MQLLFKERELVLQGLFFLLVNLDELLCLVLHLLKLPLGRLIHVLRIDEILVPQREAL